MRMWNFLQTRWDRRRVRRSMERTIDSKILGMEKIAWGILWGYFGRIEVSYLCSILSFVLESTNLKNKQTNKSDDSASSLDLDLWHCLIVVDESA